MNFTVNYNYIIRGKFSNKYGLSFTTKDSVVNYLARSI